MKISIVIPAVNPEKDFIKYVRSLLSADIGDVVIVNDGSNENKTNIFTQLDKLPNCTVLDHPINLGKSTSIKTAIAYIKDHRDDTDAIVTVDADGKHHINDVQRMSQAIMENPSSLIIGVRSTDKETNNKNNFRHGFSSVCTKILYGIDLDDTRSGLRAFSRSKFDNMLAIEGNRYEYELSSIISSQKTGLNIKVVHIQPQVTKTDNKVNLPIDRKAVKIYHEMIKDATQFIAITALKTIADLSLFFLIYDFIFGVMGVIPALMVAALISRIFASFCGQVISKRIFIGTMLEENENRFSRSVIWLGKLTLSSIAVAVLQAIIPWSIVLIKAIVDITIAIIGYQVLLHTSFKADDAFDKKTSNVISISDQQHYMELVSDIVENPLVQDMRNIQHHSKHANRLDHSVYVSFVSYKICKRMGLDYTAAARAGLLHDFQIASNLEKKHCRFVMFFKHPKIAAKHSAQTFKISKLEENIIERHMWPATPLAIPRYKESFIVSSVDKYCAIVEIMGGHKKAC